ncbi:MAG: hypothetical protein ACTSUT_07870 [Promethearchaeota archaeon]
MKKSNLTQKDWLIYLDNLNNREISKQNSSGFTTWALLGLISFLLLKLIDSLPIIYMDIENVFLFKLFITNIFNLFTVILFFAVASSLPRKEKRKIYTELIKKFYIFSGELICFIFIVGILSNISIAVNLKFYGLSILPYCAFAIFEIIFVISYIIIRITTKKEDKLPRFDSGYLYIIKGKNPLKYTYVFLGLVFSYFFLFSIYQIKQNYYILNYLSILESGFYLIVFIIAIIWLMVNNVGLAKNTWLEELERKIMLQNLSEKEIIKEFRDKFIGKDITQWLKEIEDESKEITNRFIKYFDKYAKEYNNLDKKENDLIKRITKIKTFLKNMIELRKNVFNKNIEKYKNNTEKIKYFLKQGPLGDEEEVIINEYIRNREKEGKVLSDKISKIETMIEELEKYVSDTEKLAESKDE